MAKCGIRNTGNECFLNATLQCLSVSPFILDFIKRYNKEDDKLFEVIRKFGLGKYKAQEINEKCNIILQEQSETISIEDKTILLHLKKHSYDIFIYISFREIIRKLTDKDNQDKIINNNAFMSITNELTKDTAFENLFSGEQNDPHELMAFLLDKLHNAKTSVVPIDIPSNINNLDMYYRLFITQFKARYENDYSYFVKNLYYYILNCIECSKCKHKSYNLTPNDILCVSIPEEDTTTKSDDTTVNNTLANNKSSEATNIYNCLNEMFKIDTIDYKCEKCNNTEGNLMEKKILSKPKTLIIKLKRYNTINTIIGSRTVKINKMIYYPDTINMQKYYCGELTQNYKLYAIINHTGNMNGGHYYSYIKNLQDDNKTFDDQWICCNDARVYNISNEEAMTSNNAYILFYTL